MGDSTHMKKYLKYAKPIPVWIGSRSCGLSGLSTRISPLSLLASYSVPGRHLPNIPKQLRLFRSGIGGLCDRPPHLRSQPNQHEQRVWPEQNHVGQVLSHIALYMSLWLTLISFTFRSISFFMKSLLDSRFICKYWLYGSCLVILTYTDHSRLLLQHLQLPSQSIFQVASCLIFGTLIFFVSENFLAHGKFNPSLKGSPYWQSILTFFFMITYYVAQWPVGKGLSYIAAKWSEQPNHRANPIEFILSNLSVESDPESIV